MKNLKLIVFWWLFSTYSNFCENMCSRVCNEQFGLFVMYAITSLWRKQRVFFFKSKQSVFGIFSALSHLNFSLNMCSTVYKPVIVFCFMNIMPERDQIKNTSGKFEGSMQVQSRNWKTLFYINLDAKRQGSIFFLYLYNVVFTESKTMLKALIWKENCMDKPFTGSEAWHQILFFCLFLILMPMTEPFFISRLKLCDT